MAFPLQKGFAKLPMGYPSAEEIKSHQEADKSTEETMSLLITSILQMFGLRSSIT